jgi:hypothetical protein
LHSDICGCRTLHSAERGEAPTPWARRTHNLDWETRRCFHGAQLLQACRGGAHRWHWPCTSRGLQGKRGAEPVSLRSAGGEVVACHAARQGSCRRLYARVACAWHARKVERGGRRVREIPLIDDAGRKYFIPSLRYPSAPICGTTRPERSFQMGS